MRRERRGSWLSLLSTMLLSACGPGGNVVRPDMASGGDSPDFAETGDLAVVGFKLPSGAYKVDKVTVLDDGCLVRPTDAMVGIVGKLFALVDYGNGYYELGNYDAMTNKAGPRVGMPPQPAIGASCPGVTSPPQCKTEPDQHPFAGNSGFLVRNNVQELQGGCTFRRRIVNEVVLDGDGRWSAVYQRWESEHKGCGMQAVDCGSRWTWELSFVKALSM